VITISTVLFDANDLSPAWARYDESWVDKLYRGCARNLTMPFRFVCFTERERTFSEPVETKPLSRRVGVVPDWRTALIEPFQLGEPGIIFGLDTVVTGSLDAMAAHCLTASRIAVPRDPFFSTQACNAMVLVPGGQRDVLWDAWDGTGTDMEWCEALPHDYLDELFPRQVVSYKAHVAGREDRALRDARVVYFHGRPKAPELDAAWVREHWA
jgi:hypothetical protein